MRAETQSKFATAVAAINRTIPETPAQLATAAAQVAAAAQVTWAATIANVATLGEIARTNGGDVVLVPGVHDGVNGIFRFAVLIKGPRQNDQIAFQTQGNRIGAADPDTRRRFGPSKAFFLATEQDDFAEAIVDYVAKVLSGPELRNAF